MRAANVRANVPAWHKAKPITLPKHATIDDAFAIIATACRDHWQENLPAALAGEHPEGIHQVRVGFRRFRVLLSLFGDILPADQREWLKAETKFLGDAMGPARDLDVFLNELMGPLTEKASSESDVAVLLRTVRETRDTAYGNAAAALTSPRYRRFMTRLNTWLTGRGWRTEDTKRRRRSAEHAAHAVLNRRLAKITAQAKSVAHMEPAKLHRLRIAVKKLRYGLEFFQSVLPEKRAERTSHVLKSLQDALGYVNDLDVAKRTIAMLGDRSGDFQTRAAIVHSGKKLTATFDASVKKAVPEAARAATRLRRQKPL